MKRLIDGALRFQGEVYLEHRDLFRELATGQQPEALLITCSDSRVVPDLIVQAKPGDIFICRNAGNIAPPYSDINGGVTATIEYAVAVLNVRHIIVCGHSDCGAMKALLHPEKLQGLPSVKSWLKNAARAEVVVRENHPDLDDAARIDALIEENVLAQLDNLRTHPCVASRLKSGQISLHGWVYDIESGQIRVSTGESVFLPMSQTIEIEQTIQIEQTITIEQEKKLHA
jgi:carbonic anhydrase